MPGSAHAAVATPPQRWLTALAEARSGSRAVDVVWFGDSISELDPGLVPLPWFVGRVLSGWTEEVQYRNAGAYLTPSMTTTGTPSADAEAGFGGRSVVLQPGESCSFAGSAEGVSLLWTRRPGAGSLDVTWAGDALGTIDTDGPLAHTQRTVFRRDPGHVSDAIVVTALGAAVTFEGMYLHSRNLDRGVRIWPAVRVGRTAAQFLDHPGLGLESLATLAPNLVVIATGTNATKSYGAELSSLIDAVRARTDADVVVWIPYLNLSFTLADAAAGREVAAEKGCFVVDAAATLGEPSTIDGTHPDAVTTALAGAHAAALLSGDPLGTATLIAGRVSSSVALGQEWRPGGGAIAVEDPFGSSVLSGRGLAGDQGQEWAVLLAGLARGLFGLPGPTFALGPGGDLPIDTYLSRAAKARLSINSGTGQLDLARLLVAHGGEPDATLDGAVLFTRRNGGADELVVRLPDAGDHVLAPSSASGFRPPLPCALTPAHHASAEGSELVAGRVVWVPFPSLEVPAVATHVWLQVSEPRPGWSAIAAVVATGPDGRPGSVLQVTAPGAIDLASAGMAGGELAVPARPAPGEAWWVAVLATGPADGADGGPVVAAAESLEGRPSARIGTAPVVPSPLRANGALALDGASAIPDHPDHGLADLVGALPVPSVSLQVP